MDIPACVRPESLRRLVHGLGPAGTAQLIGMLTGDSACLPAAPARLADPVEQEDLLHMAYRDAQLLLEKDPGLISERGRAVRVLLRLFETKAAMGTVVSG